MFLGNRFFYVSNIQCSFTALDFCVFLLDQFVQPLILSIHKARVPIAFENQTVVYTYAYITQESEVVVRKILHNHSVDSIMERKYGQHFIMEMKKGFKMRLQYLSAVYIFSSIATANTSHLNSTREHYMKGIRHIISTLKLSEVKEIYKIKHETLFQLNLVQLSVEYLSLSEDIISIIYNATTSEIARVANLTILNINAKFGNATSKTLKELWRVAFFETNLFIMSPYEIYTLSGKAMKGWTNIQTVLRDYTTKTIEDFYVFFQEYFRSKYMSSHASTMNRTATTSFSSVSLASGLSLDQVVRLSILDLALLIEKGK